MNAEAVLKLVKESKTWFVGTYGDEPNIAPMGMKTVLEDGTMAIANNFMNATLKNILANGKAAVVVMAQDSPECYQINGTAEYITEGAIVEQFKAIADDFFKGAVQCKGAILIKPEKAVVKTPGPGNGTVINF